MKKVKKFLIKGRFSSALTLKEETIRAVYEFIENSEDAWISYKVPSFDWSTGEHTKETNFLLTRSEWITDAEKQLERAVQSKNFLVVCRYSDGGLLSVDFSDRSWEIIDRSKKVDSELLKLRENFKKATVSRFLSAGWGVTFLAGYLTFGFLLFFIDLLAGLATEQEVRRAFFSGEGETSPLFVLPENIMRKILFLFTPLLMLVGVFIFALRFMSGGLRIWPEKINRELFHSIGFKVKRDFVPSSANNFWLALLAALAGMIVTKLFL